MELIIFLFRKIFLLPAGMLDFYFTESEMSTKEQILEKKSRINLNEPLNI